MIVPRYYEDLSVLHENTMPARAYFIPASKRMDNLVEHRDGRWHDMIHISIQTSGIRSHLIHRMYHRISHVEHMHIPLFITKMKMHQKLS